MTVRALHAASTVFVITLAGCGTPALSGAEKSRIARAEANASAYCAAKLETGAGGPQGAAAVRDYREALRATPDATYEDRTVRQVVADAAGQMDDCDPKYARWLRDALDAG